MHALMHACTHTRTHARIDTVCGISANVASLRVWIAVIPTWKPAIAGGLGLLTTHHPLNWMNDRLSLKPAVGWEVLALNWHIRPEFLLYIFFELNGITRDHECGIDFRG